MTDPWMVQNSSQQNNTVENGTKENGIEHHQQEQHQNQLESSAQQSASLEFEDNFTPIPAIDRRNNTDNLTQSTAQGNENNSNSNSGCLEPLPDSDNYLRGLERKLQKIKKGANLVEALAEKRNDCLRQLLNSGDPDNNNAVLALDQPLNNPDFYRHLQPVQALSVGELVHIVKYDQLQQEEQDNVEKQQEIEKETSVEEAKKKQE